MLGLKTFCAAPPKRIAIIGTGMQASGHVQAIAALFSDIDLYIVGLPEDTAAKFVADHHDLPLRFHAESSAPADVHAGLTPPPSKTPVSHPSAKAGRLVTSVR